MPTGQNGLFHRKVLQQALERQGDLSQIENLPQKLAILRNWRQAIESASLKKSGEVALHGDFLIDIFVRVLGYYGQIEHPAEWQLAHEQKTLTDATKSDGALGFFTNDSQDIRAIIELKSIRADLDAKQHRKDDKRSPVEQAFGYVHKAGGNCRWVIVSNYQEIRLYHASFSGKYEVFQVADLAHETEFLRFYYLLAREHLFVKTGESRVEALYRQSAEAEQAITGQFYAQYTQARRELFEHLKQQNPERSELALLAHTQQLLDRFIFICFCEDTGDLLPEKTFRKMVQRTKELLTLEHEYGDQKIWVEFKAVLHALDKGLSSHNLPAFNGELFKPDSEFESLRIADPIFETLVRLTEYDFQSDLNVNILGHIFEQSLTDLEEMRAEIRGEQTDRKQSKRKKEGIFYTPEYITRYIVEQAIGGWLDDRQRELGWETLPELTPDDEEWLSATAKKKKPNVRVAQHIAFYEAYLERLKQITVLDPACGSGAFLTQAFDYLRNEGERVNRELNRLRSGEQLGLFSRKTWDKAILRNNLFGVDLNSESVEITKLALWLKTAKKDDQLTSLNQNIKCGNSLIDDPAVAGDRAFRWEAEFSEIMPRGGFDVVIGNPPYVQSHSISEAHKTYLYSHYQTAEYQLNTFGLFLEKSINLLKENGLYSLIIPNYWLSTKYDEKLRQFLFLSNDTREVLNVFQVFESASVDTVIIIGRHTQSSQFPKFLWARSVSPKLKNIEDRLIALSNMDWATQRQIVFSDQNNATQISFEEKFELKGKHRLSEFVELKKGMQPYEEGKGHPSQTRDMMNDKVYHATSKIDDTYLPLLGARDVKRYLLLWENEWIKYGPNLAAPRSKEIFEGERILIGRIISGTHIEGTFLSETYINNTDVINILPKHGLLTSPLKALTGILLSKLCAYVLKKENVNLNRETFPKINVETLKTFPIPEIPEPSQQSLIVLVDRMLELNHQLHADTQKFLRFLDATYHPKHISTKLETFYTLSFAEFIAELGKQGVKLTKPAEFELMGLFDAQAAPLVACQKQIDATDHEIDQMVCHLYGLTAEEIESIENS